jgi:hypothetical protein
MSQPIDFKRKADGTTTSFIEVLDLRYGINSLKMDDKWTLQIQGITDRTREWL